MSNRGENGKKVGGTPGASGAGDSGDGLVFKLEGVSYSYQRRPGRDGRGRVYAIRDVNLEVRRGERLAILGPNGGGKTTLLKVLDALVPPTSGKVTGLGYDLTRGLKREGDAHAFRKRVGLVFQNPDEELFSPTVYDDVIFGPLHLGFTKREIEAKADEVLDLLGIQDIRDSHPFNLSGGEKKKAAIASVLSIDPEVILLDEPTAGLDPRSRADLMRIINDLHAKGKTIVTATHDVNAIPDIADRIYVLDGTVVAEGSTREIFSNPRLLKDANLEIPEILKLFQVLTAFGYNCEDLPLSIDEAIAQLTSTIETGGGHIHLHIHEHTHDELKAIHEDHAHRGQPRGA
ncbi:MAG: energy-coupling factor ABC transporter ATP-binding protein [Promethearchaeota archaeon]